MSFMGTLIKVAVGYAAARGVDHLSDDAGLAGLLGGSDAALGNAGSAGDLFGGLEAGAFGGLFGGGDEDSAGFGGLLSDGAGGDGSGDLLGLAGLVGVLGLAGGAAAATTRLGDILSGHIDDGAATPEEEENAKLLLRAMIQSAKSDGGIDMRDKQRILATVGDASPGEVAFVTAQMQAPLDPESLAADTPDALRERVYGAALMTIKRDSPEDARFLSRLGAALGLTHAQRSALHGQMGAPALPA